MFTMYRQGLRMQSLSVEQSKTNLNMKWEFIIYLGLSDMIEHS